MLKTALTQRSNRPKRCRNKYHRQKTAKVFPKIIKKFPIQEVVLFLQKTHSKIKIMDKSIVIISSKYPIPN